MSVPLQWQGYCTSCTQARYEWQKLLSVSYCQQPPCSRYIPASLTFLVNPFKMVVIHIGFTIGAVHGHIPWYCGFYCNQSDHLPFTLKCWMAFVYTGLFHCQPQKAVPEHFVYWLCSVDIVPIHCSCYKCCCIPWALLVDITYFCAFTTVFLFNVKHEMLVFVHIHY